MSLTTPEKAPLLRYGVCFTLTEWLIRAMLLALLLAVHHAGAVEPGVAADELILEVHPDKPRVYLHEAVPVTVTLLTGSTPVRDIHYPRLDGAAFRVTEFSPPRETRVIRDGREATAYQFAATLMPRKPGEIELGPAELRCDLLAPARGAAAFFGGSEPRAVTVRSKPIRFSILPLPTRGRPADFSGAVGRFTVSRKVTPTAIQRGDPVTVTTRIAGVGKFDRFSCPVIALPGVRGYPARARRTGNHLACEQVLLPETAARLEIPGARISFFDPLSERYRSAMSSPVSLVLTGAPPDQTPAEVALPVALPAAHVRATPSAAWPLFGGVGALLIALASTAFLATRRWPEGAGHRAEAAAVARQHLARAEAALAANDPERFYEAAFRLAQAAAAARCQRPAAGMTVGSLKPYLPPDGPGEPPRRLLADLFQECDAVRYGRSGRNRQDLSRTIERLRELIATP